MKTKIRFVAKSEYNEWQPGDYGYVDGYVCQNGVTYAVVTVEKTNRFVMVNLCQMELVEFVGRQS